MMTAGKGPSVQMRLCCSRIYFHQRRGAEAKNNDSLNAARRRTVSWYPAPSLRIVTTVMELFRLRRLLKYSTARICWEEEAVPGDRLSGILRTGFAACGWMLSPYFKIFLEAVCSDPLVLPQNVRCFLRGSNSDSLPRHRISVPSFSRCSAAGKKSLRLGPGVAKASGAPPPDRAARKSHGGPRVFIKEIAGFRAQNPRSLTAMT